MMCRCCMKVLVVSLGALYVKLDKHDIFISFIHCYEFEETVLCDVCITCPSGGYCVSPAQDDISL